MCADEPHGVSVIPDRRLPQESTHNQHQHHDLLLILTAVKSMKVSASELDRMPVSVTVTEIYSLHGTINAASAAVTFSYGQTAD